MIRKLSVIIPAYNEGNTIHLILDKLRETRLVNDIQKEIILVNDCSADNTDSAVLEYIKANPSLDIQYFKHEENMGKGAAIHTGIKNASGEYLVIQDADLEYDPREYNDLLNPVIEGFADVVYGSRFMGSNPHRILFFWHTIGNRFLTTLSNMFTNLNLSDMETCYKLFDTKVIQSLDLKEKRFGFEPEVTAKVSRVPGIRIYEVGISYYGRTYDEGKKIGWKDGFRALYSILRYNGYRSNVYLQLFVYLFIGGIAAVFNFLLFMSLRIAFPDTLSAILAFFAAAGLNYQLCITLLFRKNARWKTWAEYLIYLTTVSAIAMLDMFLTTRLISNGFTPAFSKIAATGTAFLLNFFMRKFVIFAEKDSPGL